MTKRRLPQTDSIQELAGFWDSHDLTDFEAELEEVREGVFQAGAEVRVRLSPDQLAAIKSMATAKGVSDADLIREWVDEKVHS